MLLVNFVPFFFLASSKENAMNLLPTLFTTKNNIAIILPENFLLLPLHPRPVAYSLGLSWLSNVKMFRQTPASHVPTVRMTLTEPITMTSSFVLSICLGAAERLWSQDDRQQSRLTSRDIYLRGDSVLYAVSCFLLWPLNVPSTAPSTWPH